ncbi:histidine phosphatase family protein [Gynuella sunshinyii]|uniref:Fructose-2,6-bisphosphatase n=1 Tax=Gynuella sunshinyii YC6258 TaxID=1445510 RepID=A0A0C5V2D8_9GAMM|nr:histidine phosphatase family protein [Gynuella sunshinyii]AJQ93665.1 fructose-2,6-bisphosphatase [Gynuella sunshinyii YC6258]
MRLSNVYLIRHGETEWNREGRIQGHSESTLSNQGIIQTRKAAVQLKNIPFDHIYCSSSLRTRQTLNILQPHLFPNAIIHFEDALREIHLGHWEGQLHSEVQATEPDSYHNYTNRPELFSIVDGESYTELQQRAWNWFTTMLHSQPFSNALIVSHGVWIRTLLARAINLPIHKLHQIPRLQNCAIRIIHIDDNLTPSLDPVNGMKQTPYTAD